MFICNHVLQLWGDKPLLYTCIDIHWLAIGMQQVLALNVGSHWPYLVLIVDLGDIPNFLTSYPLFAAYLVHFWSWLVRRSCEGWPSLLSCSLPGIPGPGHHRCLGMAPNGTFMMGVVELPSILYTRDWTLPDPKEPSYHTFPKGTMAWNQRLLFLSSPDIIFLIPRHSGCLCSESQVMERIRSVVRARVYLDLDVGLNGSVWKQEAVQRCSWMNSVLQKVMFLLSICFSSFWSAFKKSPQGLKGTKPNYASFLHVDVVLSFQVVFKTSGPSIARAWCILSSKGKAFVDRGCDASVSSMVGTPLKMGMAHLKCVQFDPFWGQRSVPCWGIPLSVAGNLCRTYHGFQWMFYKINALNSRNLEPSPLRFCIWNRLFCEFMVRTWLQMSKSRWPPYIVPRAFRGGESRSMASNKTQQIVAPKFSTWDGQNQIKWISKTRRI